MQTPLSSPKIWHATRLNERLCSDGFRLSATQLTVTGPHNASCLPKCIAGGLYRTNPSVSPCSFVAQPCNCGTSARFESSPPAILLALLPRVVGRVLKHANCVLANTLVGGALEFRRSRSSWSSKGAGHGRVHRMIPDISVRNLPSAINAPAGVAQKGVCTVQTPRSHAKQRLDRAGSQLTDSKSHVRDNDQKHHALDDAAAGYGKRTAQAFVLRGPTRTDTSHGGSSRPSLPGVWIGHVWPHCENNIRSYAAGSRSTHGQ